MPEDDGAPLPQRRPREGGDPIPASGQHARLRVEEAKLDIAESARRRVERPRFVAGEANQTPPAKLGGDGE